MDQVQNLAQLEQELRNARAALQVLEKGARELYDHSPLMCFTLDAEGTVIDCNDRVLQALGREAGELMGAPLWALAEEDSGGSLRDCLERLREGATEAAGPPAIEMRLRTAKGHMDASATFTALRAADGTAVEVRAFLTDISEVRRLERRMVQADRLASVGQLAAGVAHEINNPAAFVMANLSHIQGRLPLLLTLLPPGCPDEGLREFLQDLPQLCEQSLQGMRRIRDIVRDLQIFARGADAAPELLDINRLCDTVANMAWLEIRRRARLEKCYGVVPALLGHPGKLSQVLMNLVINAAQSIPEGRQCENKVVIRTAREEGGVVVAVSDTGTGIPEAVIGRIFDPFFTTKPPGKGTGLGLSVSYEIVQSHGGRIDVESRVGEGSTFRVWLPLPKEVAAAATAAPTATGPVRGPRGKVLVIDDEPELLRAVSRTLRTDHDVLLASSIAAATTLLQEQRDIDVVLCDLMMPEGSGMDLYEALPRALRERFIFVSGDTGSAVVKTFLLSSGCPHLTKPVEAADLRRAVAEAVSRRLPEGNAH